MLAAYLYQRWSAGLIEPWWISAPDFLLKAAAARGQGEAARLNNTIRDTPLICLDDVGVREPTGAQLDALLNMLDQRAGKPLIVTGNLAPELLVDVLDNRVVSRLCAGVVIEVLGEDQRLKDTFMLRG